MATDMVKLTVHIDTSRYDEALRRVRVSSVRWFAAPPSRAGKTARQYRAARRRYARTRKAIRRMR